MNNFVHAESLRGGATPPRTQGFRRYEYDYQWYEYHGTNQSAIAS